MGDAPRPSVALRVDLERRLRPLASVGFKMYPRDSNFDDVFDEAMAVMKRRPGADQITLARCMDEAERQEPRRKMIRVYWRKDKKWYPGRWQDQVL